MNRKFSTSLLRLTLCLTLWTLSSKMALGVQLVTDVPRLTCEEVQLYKPLKVFKDPALFMLPLGIVSTEPDLAWEAMKDESPLLTKRQGTVQIMRLSEAKPFRNFGAIAKFYEVAEPGLRLRGDGAGESPAIVQLKFCGKDAYADTLGFVLADELASAQIDRREEGHLPPSTRKIPQLSSVATALGH